MEAMKTGEDLDGTLQSLGSKAEVPLGRCENLIPPESGWSFVGSNPRRMSGVPVLKM